MASRSLYVLLFHDCSIVHQGIAEGMKQNAEHTISKRNMDRKERKIPVKCNKHLVTAANHVSSYIQADKLQTLLGAAKVQEVEPIWTSIFAKVNT